MVEINSIDDIQKKIDKREVLSPEELDYLLDHKPKLAGEYWVRLVEKLFKKWRDAEPEWDPHQCFSAAMSEKKRKEGVELTADIIKLTVGQAAWFALLPESICGRASGLYFLREDWPELYSHAEPGETSFADEETSIWKPILNLTDEEKERLYCKNNPRCADTPMNIYRVRKK